VVLHLECTIIHPIPLHQQPKLLPVVVVHLMDLVVLDMPVQEME
jgi:hypothetical protein